MKLSRKIQTLNRKQKALLAMKRFKEYQVEKQDMQEFDDEVDSSTSSKSSYDDSLESEDKAPVRHSIEAVKLDKLFKKVDRMDKKFQKRFDSIERMLKKVVNAELDKLNKHLESMK